MDWLQSEGGEGVGKIGVMVPKEKAALGFTPAQDTATLAQAEDVAPPTIQQVLPVVEAVVTSAQAAAVTEPVAEVEAAAIVTEAAALIKEAEVATPLVAEAS